MKIYQDQQIPTKSDDTKEKYLMRSEQLIKKSKKELDIKPHNDIDVRQFAIWLIEHKINISRSTWRQYKNSVIYYLEILDNNAAYEALDYLRDIDSTGCILKSTKTSSQKLKRIPLEDWIKLESYLTNKKNKWHEELRVWMRSSIITGLRPVEWQTAKLSSYENKSALIVQNAKNTNGRAHGPTRTLLLKDMNQEDYYAMKTHLNNIHTFNGMGEYEYYYRGCAVALYKVCRKLWPRRKKHITLYSARHQFSANAKSSGFTQNEVAALMGHAVDITATIHYGRKKSGYEELQILPTNNDIQKIRQSNTTDFKIDLNNHPDQ